MKKGIIYSSLFIAISLTTLSSCNKNRTVESKYYQSDKVTSVLPIKKAVQSYVDKVDVNYGYNLAYKLAYDSEYSQHLGWRLAGSEAEHKTAELLKEEMLKIGIKENNITMEKLPCDSFDFKDSSLTLDGHEEIKLSPACYQLNGTYNELGEIDTYTYPLIDIGTGTEKEFKKIIDDATKTKGYIALIGINQDNDWIDTFIKQSYIYGAKALVTYSIGGYGMENEDAIPVTDVCAGGNDTIPTCAISLKQAEQLKKIIGTSKTINCKLKLDCAVKAYDEAKGEDNPYTYDVYGVIPGKDRSKQIVLGAHYDKYWYGFQDDSCAIGLIFTVVKSMIDSKYTPEHDIVLCCTGAEEWGKTDSPGDWTTGAWELLEKDKEWADKTIALINCELPAHKPDSKHENSVLSLGSVPEYRSLVNNFINNTGLIVTSGDIKLNREGFDSAVNEDGIAYRYHGCPYFINYFSDDEFQSHKYHTSIDNKDTYDKDTFLTNINMYGALTMYLDNLAVVPLDFIPSTVQLNEGLNESVCKDAEISSDLIDRYKKLMDEFYGHALESNDLANKLNYLMWNAKKVYDQEEIAKIKVKADQLSIVQRNVFKSLQEYLLKVNDFDCYYGHREFNNSYISLKNCLNDIKYDNKPLFLESVRNINTLHCSKYVDYNVKVGDYYLDKYSNLETDTLFRKQWMYKKLETNIECKETRLGQVVNDIALDQVELKNAEEPFKAAYEQAKKDLNEILINEIKFIEIIVSQF